MTGPRPDGVTLSAVPSADGDAPVLEVLGHLERLRPPAVVMPAPPALDAEAMQSLRMLALETLVEVSRLRQLVSDRDCSIESLSQDVAIWQERTRTLSAARTQEKAAAHRRERELVSVLHQALSEKEQLRVELEWRRRPWWRRGRRPPANPATPAQILASALR